MYFFLNILFVNDFSSGKNLPLFSIVSRRKLSLFVTLFKLLFRFLNNFLKHKKKITKHFKSNIVNISIFNKKC